MKDISTIVAPLFVPADRPERFAKAAASGADAVVLDLEDAVAASQKETARAALSADFTDLPVIVRINAVGTPWHEADLAAVAPAIRRNPAAQGRADERPCGRCRHTHRHRTGGDGEWRGRGARHRAVGTRGAPGLRIGRLCADRGCDHVDDALAHARSELVFASRLGGLSAPFDGVTTDLDDPRIAQNDARRARASGFGGKLALHPRQIGAIRAGFAPQPGETS